MTRLLARRRRIEEIAFAIPVALFLKIVAMIILSRASDSTTILKQPPPHQPPQLLQQPVQRPQQHPQLQRQQLQAPLQQLQQRLRQQLRQQRFNQPAEYQNKLNLGFSLNFLKN